jgi:predicted peptidase
MGHLAYQAKRRSIVSNQVRGAIPGTQALVQFKKTPDTIGPDYLIYVPKDYEKFPDQRWPLILFLHGIGECRRSADTPEEVEAKLHRHGVPAYIHDVIVPGAREFPFVVISPQCREHEAGRNSTRWSAPDLEKLLEEAKSHYRVDGDRIYVTGLSIGGDGTWDLALQYPHEFAAIAPVSSTSVSFDRDRAETICHLPVRAVVGTKDVQCADATRRMLQLLKQACVTTGTTDRTLLIEGEWDHAETWPPTYGSKQFDLRPYSDLYTWFERYRRS